MLHYQDNIRQVTNVGARRGNNSFGLRGGRPVLRNSDCRHNGGYTNECTQEADSILDACSENIEGRQPDNRITGSPIKE